MKLALLTEMVNSSPEDGDSTPSSVFSDIWKLVGPVLITLVPILMRLAFARNGNNAAANGVANGESSRQGSKRAGSDEPLYANNDLSPSAREQSRREPASAEV